MRMTQLQAYYVGKQVKRHVLVHEGLPPLNAQNLAQYVASPWALSAIGRSIAGDNGIRIREPEGE